MSEKYLQGKTVTFTGTLSSFTRKEAEAEIEERGGRVAGSLSKVTDYLVAGDKAGSKLAKAVALGVEILNEDDFVMLLESD